MRKEANVNHRGNGLACLGLALLFVLAACSSEPASTTALEEQNMALVRHVHAEMAKGNISIMDEVLAPGYLRHCQAMPPGLQELRDVAVFKSFLREFVDSAPGYQDTIDVIFAKDEMVAYVSTMTGIQSGAMGGLPATGKEFTVVNLVIHRFEEDKIAETWVTWDNMAMLTQLGLFPPPGD